MACEGITPVSICADLTTDLHLMIGRLYLACRVTDLLIYSLYLGCRVTAIHMSLQNKVVRLIICNINQGRRNGAADSAPDCCTIRGAVAGFESFTIIRSP